MKPVVLVATTARWFPTARLVMALASAGFMVEAICPSGHPLGKTGSAGRLHRYKGLRPLSSLLAAISAAKPDLVVPGDDLAARHLLDLHRLELLREKGAGEVCSLIQRSLGSSKSFPTLFARSSFLQLALEEGVRTPHTEVVTGLSSLKTLAAATGFPMVLKADGTSGGDGVRIVHTMEEAGQAFQELSAPPLLARAAKRFVLDRDSTLLRPSFRRQGPVVNAQTFVAGREATSAMACWKGEVLANVQFEVIHKAQKSGHATVVRAIQNDDMTVAAERMARRLQLSGLHGLDFMLEVNTGNAHLIEINPRSTQVCHLPLGPGRDLPGALYAAVSGEALNERPSVTGSEIIALFPQEWIRDAASVHLRTGFHDVPWEAPDLVRECVVSRRKQRTWYAPQLKEGPR